MRALSKNLFKSYSNKWIGKKTKVFQFVNDDSFCIEMVRGKVACWRYFLFKPLQMEEEKRILKKVVHLEESSEKKTGRKVWKL